MTESIHCAQINLFDHPMPDGYVNVVLLDRGMLAKNAGPIDEANNVDVPAENK